MPTSGTPRASYRLPTRTLAQIQDLRRSAKAGTFTATQVVVGAIDSQHRAVYGRRSITMRPLDDDGRRSADMTPVRRTKG